MPRVVSGAACSVGTSGSTEVLIEAWIGGVGVDAMHRHRGEGVVVRHGQHLVVGSLFASDVYSTAPPHNPPVVVQASGRARTTRLQPGRGMRDSQAPLVLRGEESHPRVGRDL